MSGILKPFILPDAAATKGGAVNVDLIASYEGVTVTNPLGGASGAFSLKFSMKAGVAPQIQTWEYPDQTTLDAAIALVDNTVGAVVA